MTERQKNRPLFLLTVQVLLIAAVTLAFGWRVLDVYAETAAPAQAGQTVAQPAETGDTQDDAQNDADPSGVQDPEKQTPDNTVTDGDTPDDTVTNGNGSNDTVTDGTDNGGQNPDNPDNPDDPTNPDNPDNPDDPDQPDEPTIPDGWDESGEHYYENGEMVKDTYKEIEGSWYHFDKEGRAVSVTVYTAGDTPFGSGNRVWFYNVSGGSYGSDMILVESNGRYGLIDTGNRYDNTITDKDGTVYTASAGAQLSQQKAGKNGRDGMIYLIQTLGVEHLDFIIGTHAHSDHIGGIPEIAELLVCGKDGMVHHLIDEATIFLYKNYQHISAQEDDLGGANAEGWHNQAFVYQAVKAVTDHGGTAVDLSCGTSVKEGSTISVNYSSTLQQISGTHVFSHVSYAARSATNPFDDRLTLQWGGITMDLYNLFTLRNVTEENINSLVTVLTMNGHKVYLGGDINVQNCAEQKIAKVVAADHGTFDVVKTSHHGNNNSNSKDLVDLLRPKLMITTGNRTDALAASPSESYTVLKYYAGAHYGTQFYEVGAAGKMLVLDFSGGAASLHAVHGEGAQAAYVSADTCKESNVPANGWAHWGQNFGDEYEALWYYFVNGRPATSWTNIEGDWYYFNTAGVMQKNCWKKDTKGWCYLGSDGIMYTHRWARDTHGWCWMDASGHWVSGPKWIKGNDGWYYINAKGYCVFNKWIKDSKGWCYVGSDGRCVTNGWARDKVGWCWLNASGHMVYGKWIKDNKGDWYYIKKSGYMAADEWAKDSHGWMYMAGNGKISRAKWVKYKKDWYYLKADGYMATGTLKIGSKTYKFDGSGKWVK